MTEAISCRSLAAQMRREARAAGLPRVRELKLAAATRWDVLAEELERFGAPPAMARTASADWIF